MTEGQLALAKELLEAVRDGDGEVDKAKKKSKEPVVYYRLAIKV